MAKRISDKQKREIIEDFINNKTLEELSEKYNFTKLTISRNLKKNLGEIRYSELINMQKLDIGLPEKQIEIDKSNNGNDSSSELSNQEIFQENSFLEIEPLDYEIDNIPQKDLSSISIEEVDLPKTVFMVVDKKIELEIKLLKDYVEWNFLSAKELERKTIEIYFDLKIAKRSCSREQKVIKVPNSEVFKLVAPILRSRGISRIVSSEVLISL